MTAHDLDHVADGKMPLSEASLHIPDPKDLDPSPPYTESAVPPQSSAPTGPSRLHILGATWGGINVTSDIQGLIEVDKSSQFQRLKLNMHIIHTQLLPDPEITIIKTLTILYQYDGGDLHVLNASQFAPQINVKITPTAHLDQSTGIRQALFPKFITTLSGNPWRSASGNGRVEILAVLYGTGRIQTPDVLEDLASFFEGRRGQIRTTTEFFRTDPWPGHRKSWTVYFRFVGSGLVQCVSGMENRALELPWRQG
ncbi:hypothetical protein QBC34DRAFT_83284 [Podospora aff. communis PSN243]|uniref:Uncharacterized protein n=1 Tax=Podospora aff. communis PSN243 TaxID=3040156 RepID=A0AAV9GMJ5_9PEZI|nr:hypothetical protein QBC34DRAFT_83284 [Podospora aff. communis PSN243]